MLAKGILVNPLTGAVAVLPLIAIKDELEQGILIEADRLPGITETFYAVTLERRFPNPILQRLIAPEAQG